MNLSSYLQMPPAPNASKSTASGPASGLTAGARVDAGNSLGLDFAQIMARQLERLPQMQRQDLAASGPKAAPAVEDNAHTTQRSGTTKDSQDTQAREDLEKRENTSSARQPRTSDAPARRSTQRPEEQTSSDGDTPQDDAPRAQPSRATQKVRIASGTDPMDAALLASLNALPNAGPALANDAALASQTHNTSASLQTIALSPHIQIITDPKQAPNTESLAAFAKSMGLDENAIQALLAADGQSPANHATQVTGKAIDGSVAPPAWMTGLQNTAASATPSAADALTTLTAQVHVQTQAQTGSASLLAPDAKGLPAALLPPMSAADLASIEQIQITVMPAAINSGNTLAASALPSTQDVLSLLTGEVQAQDIAQLSAQFESGDQPAAGSDQHSPAHESPSTPFAQVLSQSNNTPASASNATASAAPASDMQEVYNQLSDKLATEMAARMHKQLSDGQWKMKFGLRPAHLGGVEIQLEMKDGKLDAVFRADNPLTRDLLQNSSQRLREALENFGIHAGQVHVGQQGGNAQQNASRNSANQPQVGDNSPLQVKGDDSVVATTVASNKANASLLDLYA